MTSTWVIFTVICFVFGGAVGYLISKGKQEQVQIIHHTTDEEENDIDTYIDYTRSAIEDSRTKHQKFMMEAQLRIKLECDEEKKKIDEDTFKKLIETVK